MQLIGRRTTEVADNKGLVAIAIAALVIAAMVATLAVNSLGLNRPGLGVDQIPANITQALPGSHPWIAPDGHDGSLGFVTVPGSQVWITPDGQDAYRATPTDSSLRRVVAD